MMTAVKVFAWLFVWAFSLFVAGALVRGAVALAVAALLLLWSFLVLVARKKS